MEVRDHEELDRLKLTIVGISIRVIEFGRWFWRGKQEWEYSGLHWTFLGR